MGAGDPLSIKSRSSHEIAARVEDAAAAVSTCLDREAEMAIMITPLAVDFDPELEKRLRPIQSSSHAPMS